MFAWTTNVYSSTMLELCAYNNTFKPCKLIKPFAADAIVDSLENYNLGTWFQCRNDLSVVLFRYLHKIVKSNSR